MSPLNIFLFGLLVYGFSGAFGVSSGTEDFISTHQVIATMLAKEQMLCEMLLNHYNSFVDMVHFILDVTFSLDNVFFTGDTQVFVYSANKTASPKCVMFNSKGAKVLRADVLLMIDILNKGSRVRLEKCLLETHLRVESTGDNLVIIPQLVDVHFPGYVYHDGELVNRTRVEEILRPVLIKGFTSFAEKHLSYSGSRSSALYVNPKLALVLLKQLFFSCVAQL